MTWHRFFFRTIMVCLVFAARASGADEPSRLIIPAYGNPCCGGGRELWQSLIDIARPGVLDVVLNPNSGPGRSPIDPNYISDSGQTGPLLDLHQAGASIYGYVHTSWAQRDITQVLAEIERYFDPSFYRGHENLLDGIFVDEVSTDLANLDYYQQLVQHMDRQHAVARVIANPGASTLLDTSGGQSGKTPDDYLRLFDLILTFEGSGASYRRTDVTPEWTVTAGPERFAHVIHSESTRGGLLEVVQLAAERNVGAIFVTDDQTPNPYDRIPAYWDELSAAVIPAVDIDELSAAVRSGSRNQNYDLNEDGSVDREDRRFWVQHVARTNYGDANLDTVFDSQDLIAVFQRGQYEDSIALNALWRSGDWDGNGDFESSDLVLALRTGSYQAAATPVPEPNGAIAVCCLLLLIGRRRVRLL